MTKEMIFRIITPHRAMGGRVWVTNASILDIYIDLLSGGEFYAIRHLGRDKFGYRVITVEIAV